MNEVNVQFLNPVKSALCAARHMPRFNRVMIFILATIR